MSLVSYALTTLANMKTYLGITSSSYDSLLTNLINSVKYENLFGDYKFFL